MFEFFDYSYSNLMRSRGLVRWICAHVRNGSVLFLSYGIEISKSQLMTSNFLLPTK